MKLIIESVWVVRPIRPLGALDERTVVKAESGGSGACCEDRVSVATVGVIVAPLGAGSHLSMRRVPAP